MLGFYGRQRYIRWAEIDLLKRQVEDAREKYDQMYLETSQIVDTLRANKAVDSHDYVDKHEHIEYLLHTLKVQKQHVKYLELLHRQKRTNFK